jgi:hypothetical protein
MQAAALLAAFLAIILFVAAYQGTANINALATQVENDVFSSNGSTGFLVWAGAIALLAVIGSVLKIPRATKLFMALVIAVYFLKNGNGFFSSFTSAFMSAQKSAAASATVAGEGSPETSTGLAEAGSSSTANNVATSTAATAQSSFTPSTFLGNVVSGLGSGKVV